MISKVKNLCDLAHASYTRKSVTLSILIGIAAGLGSIIFYWSLTAATHILLGLGAGYAPPMPTGEGATIFTGVARPWVLSFLRRGDAEWAYSLPVCSRNQRGRA